MKPKFYHLDFILFSKLYRINYSLLPVKFRLLNLAEFYNDFIMEEIQTFINIEYT